MRQILIIVSIFIFSLIITSCGEKEEDYTTTNETTTTTTDTTSPAIAEVTAVTTPTNDTTPDYTFSSSETGTISYGGSGSSSITSAKSGNNKSRLLAHSIFPPMHLNAFNTQNILLFANKNKFKLRHIDTPGKLDMDLLTTFSDELEDDNLKEISLMDEKTKAYFQYLTSYLDSSSHMRVVFER